MEVLLKRVTHPPEDICRLVVGGMEVGLFTLEEIRETADKLSAAVKALEKTMK